MTVMYYTLSSCQLRSLFCSRFLLGFSVCFVLSYKLSRLVVIPPKSLRSHVFWLFRSVSLLFPLKVPVSIYSLHTVLRVDAVVLS